MPPPDTVPCPICGELVDIDHVLRERACGHAIQRCADGGLNVAYSLESLARNLTRAFGVPLVPRPEFQLHPSISVTENPPP